MRSGFFSRMLAGMVLIAIGVLFMLSQLNVIESIDFGYLFSTYWPVFMIYFGLQSMIASARFGAGAALWNMIVVLFGVFFLLHNLDVEGFTYQNMSKLIVPAIIILVGFSMLFRRPSRKPGSRRWDDWSHVTPPPPPAPPQSGEFKSAGLPDLPETTEQARREEPAAGAWEQGSHRSEREERRARREQERAERDAWRDANHWNGWQHGSKHGGKTQYSNFVGDFHIGQDYWELTPLEVSHFVGDTVIDLTKATIPFGETKINVSAFIGDVKVYVPNDIEVEMKVQTSVFMGDLRVLDRREGGMFKNLALESPGYRDADKKIRLNASMFIGDVIVQRVG